MASLKLLINERNNNGARLEPRGTSEAAEFPKELNPSNERNSFHSTNRYVLKNSIAARSKPKDANLQCKAPMICFVEGLGEVNSINIYLTFVVQDI